MRAYMLGVLCLVSAINPAKATVPAPVLQADFNYSSACNTTTDSDAKALLTDIAVGLAGKAVESMIDAAAARTQPEATVLDAVVPLDGFYCSDGSIAVRDGTLTIHNGSDKEFKDATLKGVFKLTSSNDRSAFRFTVVEWEFDKFLKERSTQVFQSHSRRDVALKIEFLTPGSASLGTRAAFIEHIFPAVDTDAIKKLFVSNQKLPWFAAPPRPDKKDEPGLVLPLNLRVTVVETTRPNQLGLWIRALAQENRQAVSALVQDSVRKTLDPAYEATEGAKLAEAAGTAYGAYKAAWDDLKAHHGAKPTATQDSAAIKAWEAAFIVKDRVVASKRTLARSAFETAGLAWPGNLPNLSSD